MASDTQGRPHRVLFVTELPLVPRYGGERIRCHNLVESLARHFGVVVLSGEGDPACTLDREILAWGELPPYRARSLIDKVDPRIRHTILRQPEWSKRLHDTCARYRPALVYFGFGHWGQYVPIVRRFSARTVMDTHNAQSRLTAQECRTIRAGKHYLEKRMLAYAQRYHEQHLFRRFDRVVSVSEQDRRYHARFVGKERSVLIPNYVRRAHYNVAPPVARENDLLVMTGNFTVFQNQQGLTWFLEKVWPAVRRQVPGARLVLVGRGSDDLSASCSVTGVTCTGTVPDVAPYLRRAAAAVVPLIHGSGTRFKVLEALACETPVVSTSRGVKGIRVTSQSAVLADTAQAFAGACVDLMRDPAKGTQLARAGLDVLERDYGFEVNTERVRQLVEQVLAQ